MLTIWQSVTIKSISKEWVARQKFIEQLGTIYTIEAICDNTITLKSNRWKNTFKKWQVTLKIVKDNVDSH